MHDYHAVKALVERLTSEPDDFEVERISEVRIRAGVAFSPEALQQAYEMLTRDTPLEGSRLVIEELSDEHGCPECRTSWTLTPDDVAGHLLICPSCGAPSEIEGAASLAVVGVGRTARVP
jgi:hydrogenase nickel incorporation protein HypA/HybF